jgi:hypothetical protein
MWLFPVLGERWALLSHQQVTGKGFALTAVCELVLDDAAFEYRTVRATHPAVQGKEGAHPIAMGHDMFLIRPKILWKVPADGHQELLTVILGRGIGVVLIDPEQPSTVAPSNPVRTL